MKFPQSNFGSKEAKASEHAVQTFSWLPAYLFISVLFAFVYYLTPKGIFQGDALSFVEQIIFHHRFLNTRLSSLSLYFLLLSLLKNAF